MITAYRKKVTVRPDGRIDMKDFILKPGTKAEIIILVESSPENTKDRPQRVQEWQSLFAETQVLPQAQTITEEEIAAEIAAYRAVQK